MALLALWYQSARPRALLGLERAGELQPEVRRGPAFSPRAGWAAHREQRRLRHRALRGPPGGGQPENDEVQDEIHKIVQNEKVSKTSSA